MDAVAGNNDDDDDDDNEEDGFNDTEAPDTICWMSNKHKIRTLMLVFFFSVSSS